MEAGANQRVFFGIGFFGVLLGALVLRGFDPDLGLAPSLTTAPTAPLGFAFEPTTRGLPQRGAWSGRVVVADFDADGNPDLAAGNRTGDGLHVFFGDGVGGFGERSRGMRSIPSANGLAVGDLDDDRIPDLIGTTVDAGLVAHRFDGRTRWRPLTLGDATDAVIADVDVTDLDEDGRLDVIALSADGAHVLHYRPTPAGYRPTTIISTNATEAEGRVLRAVDLDRDGRRDVIVATTRGARAYLNTPEGWIDCGRGLPQVDVTAITAADVDGDGRTDLALAVTAIDRAPGLAIYAMTDSGDDLAWTRIGRGLPTDRPFSAVHFGDFDCDGRTDLAAIGPTHGIEIFRRAPDGTWRPAGWIPDTRCRRATLTSADLNRDGRADLILAHGDPTGGIVCFLNRSIARP